MGRDQKKHEKQKKREQKLLKEKLHAGQIETERRRRDQYPKIFVDPTNGDPEFVELVKSSLVGIDFDDRTLFQGGERTFYKLLRQYGFPYALQCLKEAMQVRLDSGDEFGRVGQTQMLMGFGQLLLDRISETDRRRLMPFNDMHVKFEGREIVVMFSSLLSSPGDKGRIYYGRQTPTIEFEGKQWNVGFSRHAIERICERINPRYIHYGASGDAHALFADCVYFEPVMLHGQQPGFTFWDMCFGPPFVQYSTYVEGILGNDNVDAKKGECYYRVGYCPVVFEGNFAKAKTFLYPGYTTTPEYGLALRTRLGRAEKDLLLRQATTQIGDDVILNDSTEAIKWFHDHGIPQVVQMKHNVFVHYSDKRRRHER